MTPRARQRGQALVEFAILLPFLLSLVIGSVDFGRVFGQNSGIYGAAREGVRQAIYYDDSSGLNPYFNDDNHILLAAVDELGSQGGSSLTMPLNHDRCFSQSSAPDSSLYPTTADTGYLYICRTLSGSADNLPHIQVTILWTQGLFTPFVQQIVGTPHLHAIVDGTEQTP